MMDEKAEKSTQSFDISSLIGTLLSNPETLSKIGNIISKIGDSENSASSTPNTNYSSNINNLNNNINTFSEEQKG